MGTKRFWRYIGNDGIFLLILDFAMSSCACFVFDCANENVIKKISERKAVRTIIRSICGVLSFVVTFGVLLICFFGK